MWLALFRSLIEPKGFVMYKIDKNRQLILENGLIEVDRFPRNWKIYSNQLWDLGQENAAKLVRVMSPNFKDARIYKSEQVEEAPPNVIELPRYYAVGISQKGDWYTEESTLAFGALPSYIVERARQKLTGNPALMTLRDGWHIILSWSLLLTVATLTIMLLIGNLVSQNTGFGALGLTIATLWLKIGPPSCVGMFALKTLFLYRKRQVLEEALEIVERPPVILSQPLPSSSQVL